MLTAIIYEKPPKPKKLTRKEQRHLYYLKHKEIINQQCHLYYLEHRDEMIKKNREWNEIHGKARVNCDICDLEMNRASLYRHKKRHEN